MKKRIILAMASMLIGANSLLQAANSGNFIRGNAKFNVVAIVIALIFGGIVFFLFRMDKRLKNLENNQEKKS